MSWWEKNIDLMDEEWEIEGSTNDAKVELCILAEETIKS